MDPDFDQTARGMSGESRTSLGLDMKQIFFTNLQLLGFDAAAMEIKYKIPFNKDMFNLSNKAGAEAVLYFLFNRLNLDMCRQQFRDCWPITDKKAESAFRKLCCIWLQNIQKEEVDAKLPRINASLFMAPGGDKFCHLVFTFSSFVLLQTVKTEHGLKEGSVLGYPTLTSQNKDLGSVLETTSVCVAARHRTRFFSTLGQTIAAKQHWQTYADEMTRDLRRMTKEVRDLEREKRDLVQDATRSSKQHTSPIMQQSDVSEHAARRGRRLHQVRGMWKGVEGYLERAEEEREVIASILDRTLAQYTIDAANIKISIPHLMLRECEQEIRRRRVDDIYEGGELNLVSVMQLWNLALKMYLQRLEKGGLVELTDEVGDMTNQAHTHSAYLANTTVLRQKMERDIPRRKNTVEQLRGNFGSEATPSGAGMSAPSPPVSFDPLRGHTGATPTGPVLKMTPDLVETPEAAGDIASSVLRSSQRGGGVQPFTTTAFGRASTTSFNNNSNANNNSNRLAQASQQSTASKGVKAGRAASRGHGVVPRVVRHVGRQPTTNTSSLQKGPASSAAKRGAVKTNRPLASTPERPSRSQTADLDRTPVPLDYNNSASGTETPKQRAHSILVDKIVKAVMEGKDEEEGEESYHLDLQSLGHLSSAGLPASNAGLTYTPLPASWRTSGSVHAAASSHRYPGQVSPPPAPHRGDVSSPSQRRGGQASDPYGREQADFSTPSQKRHGPASDPSGREHVEFSTPSRRGRGSVLGAPPATLFSSHSPAPSHSSALRSSTGQSHSVSEQDGSSHTSGSRDTRVSGPQVGLSGCDDDRTTAPARSEDSRASQAHAHRQRDRRVFAQPRSPVTCVQHAGVSDAEDSDTQSGVSGSEVKDVWRLGAAGVRNGWEGVDDGEDGGGRGSGGSLAEGWRARLDGDGRDEEAEDFNVVNPIVALGEDAFTSHNMIQRSPLFTDIQRMWQAAVAEDSEGSSDTPRKGPITSLGHLASDHSNREERLPEEEADSRSEKADSGREMWGSEQREDVTSSFNDSTLNDWQPVMINGDMEFMTSFDEDPMMLSAKSKDCSFVEREENLSALYLDDEVTDDVTEDGNQGGEDLGAGAVSAFDSMVDSLLQTASPVSSGDSGADAGQTGPRVKRQEDSPLISFTPQRSSDSHAERRKELGQTAAYPFTRTETGRHAGESRDIASATESSLTGVESAHNWNSSLQDNAGSAQLSPDGMSDKENVSSPTRPKTKTNVRQSPNKAVPFSGSQSNSGQALPHNGSGSPTNGSGKKVTFSPDTFPRSRSVRRPQPPTVSGSDDDNDDVVRTLTGEDEDGVSSGASLLDESYNPVEAGLLLQGKSPARPPTHRQAWGDWNLSAAAHQPSSDVRSPAPVRSHLPVRDVPPSASGRQASDTSDSFSGESLATQLSRLRKLKGGLTSEGARGKDPTVETAGGLLTAVEGSGVTAGTDDLEARLLRLRNINSLCLGASGGDLTADAGRLLAGGVEGSWGAMLTTASPSGGALTGTFALGDSGDSEDRETMPPPLSRQRPITVGKEKHLQQAPVFVSDNIFDEDDSVLLPASP